MPELTIQFYDHPRTIAMLEGTEKVGYSWTRCELLGELGDVLTFGDPADARLDPELLKGVTGHTHTIECLWVWHDCDEIHDHPDTVPEFKGKRVGWTPSGATKHDLITVDPLHIEASILWPTCGLHGFIRGGRWVEAG